MLLHAKHQVTRIGTERHSNILFEVNRLKVSSQSKHMMKHMDSQCLTW